MSYLGTKPANQVIDSTQIADGTVTPSDLSTGHPNWDTSGNVGIGAAPVAGYGKLQVRNGFVYVNEDGADTRQMYLRTNYGGAPAIQIATNDPLVFATNNTERMRIDSSGRVTMPYQPAFYARRTSGYNSSGVIPFDDISVNRGNHFNGTRFTAPVDGLYFSTGSWLPNSNSSVQGWIQKNGTRVSAYAYNLQQDNHATANVIVSLVAGDYLEFSSNADGTEGYYCHFGAYLIG